MPVDYKQYPKNWFTEIRPRILERENNRCKFCGVKNYSVGFYQEGYFNVIQKYDSYKEARRFRNQWNSENTLQYIIKVLTIMHIDQDITNNQDQNLAVACQRCHLRHDGKYRMANKLRRTGQLIIIFPNDEPILNRA